MDKLILVVAQKDYLQRETGVLRIWSSGKHPRALIGLKVRHNSEEERKARRPLLRQLFSQRRRADRPRVVLAQWYSRFVFKLSPGQKER